MATNMSYLEKLERIREKMTRNSAEALSLRPDDESTQYKILIEAFEEISTLLSSQDNWLDLSSKQYTPRSVSAPPANRKVDRMAWAVHVVGLITNALQDMMTQNGMFARLLDSIEMTPVTVKEPRLPQRDNGTSSGSSLLDALPSGQSISRQQRVRKFSGSGPRDAHLFSPTGRPAQSQLRTPPMDDDKRSPKSTPASVLKAAVGLNKKVSDLDLNAKPGSGSEAELKQFHAVPLDTKARERSASTSSTLNSFLGKGRSETKFDPSNKI